ncbi:MAG: chemotaxis protein CheW [Nitrospinaceae bacterium]
MSEEKQFCTFYLEGHFFGIDVLEVQEVFRFQEMTSIPLAPDTISGLINLRGQIITAIDLRRLLHLKDREEGDMPMNVVVRTADEVVSLLVDEIGDVLEVEGNLFEQPPENLQGPLKNLIRGVYKLQGNLLLILDTEKVVKMPVTA